MKPELQTILSRSNYFLSENLKNTAKVTEKLKDYLTLQERKKLEKKGSNRAVYVDFLITFLRSKKDAVFQEFIDVLNSTDNKACAQDICTRETSMALANKTASSSSGSSEVKRKHYTTEGRIKLLFILTDAFNFIMQDSLNSVKEHFQSREFQVHCFNLTEACEKLPKTVAGVDMHLGVIGLVCVTTSPQGSLQTQLIASICSPLYRNIPKFSMFCNLNPDQELSSLQSMQLTLDGDPSYQDAFLVQLEYSREAYGQTFFTQWLDVLKTQNDFVKSINLTNCLNKDANADFPIASVTSCFHSELHL